MSKVIYLTRHGQSQHNVNNKLGGNSNITLLGRSYSKKLFDFFDEKEINNLKLYTSELARTQQTAKLFDDRIKKKLSFLNEINAGIFENESYEYIKENYPTEHNKRKKDKFNYRYPEGESYNDLNNRISKIFPIIDKDFKEDKNILIVSHNAVLRLIYGKLLNIPQKEIPHINIKLHCIYKFELINNTYKLTVLDFSPKILV